jgi:hypothetical protein
MVKNILVWWVYFLCLWVPNQDVGKVHLSRVELSEMFGLSGHSYTDCNPHLLQTSPSEVCEVICQPNQPVGPVGCWCAADHWRICQADLEAAFDASPLGDVGASAIPALLAYSTPTSTGALLLMWQIRKTALVSKSLHILPFAHNNIILLYIQTWAYRRMPLKMWHASKSPFNEKTTINRLIFGHHIFKQVGYDSRIPNLILRVVPPMKKC